VSSYGISNSHSVPLALSIVYYRRRQGISWAFTIPNSACRRCRSPHRRTRPKTTRPHRNSLSARFPPPIHASPPNGYISPMAAPLQPPHPHAPLYPSLSWHVLTRRFLFKMTLMQFPFAAFSTVFRIAIANGNCCRLYTNSVYITRVEKNNLMYKVNLLRYRPGDSSRVLLRGK